MELDGSGQEGAWKAIGTANRMPWKPMESKPGIEEKEDVGEKMENEN